MEAYACRAASGALIGGIGAKLLSSADDNKPTKVGTAAVGAATGCQLAWAQWYIRARGNARGFFGGLAACAGLAVSVSLANISEVAC
jgi:hypothetical protein